MDINLALGIVGVILSIASLIYAIYVTKKSRREKILAYELLAPVPVADAISEHGGFSLQVSYKMPDNSIVPIDGAFTQYLRFANFGRIPITEKDFASNDLPRLEIIGGNVLDVALVDVTKESCQIKLGDISQNKEIRSSFINFEFLDYKDGGLIRILTDTEIGIASLKGTIIGMPNGINMYSKKEPETAETLNYAGKIYGVFQIFILAAIPFLYYYITGSWAYVELLLLPFAAIIIPLLIYFITYALLTERTRFRFPATLSPPNWYETQLHWYVHFPQSKRHKLVDDTTLTNFENYR